MLNFLQKWVELEVTNDQERFFKSIAALEEAHIPYRQKGQHMNHGTMEPEELAVWARWGKTPATAFCTRFL